VTAATFNYAPLAVLVVLGFAGIWWLVSARKWFTGRAGRQYRRADRAGEPRGGDE